MQSCAPRFRRPESSDAECGACPAARRCWDQPAPDSGLQARRQPRLDRSAALIQQGQQPDGVYVVVSGCLTLRETATNGFSRVVGFCLPGEIVGLEGWVRGAHPYTARSAGTTFVCRLNLPAAGSGHAGKPLLERLLIKCALQMDRSTRPWPGLPAPERVVAFLGDFAQRAQLKGNIDNAFKLPVTRADIASYLGLAEETVVRALGQLQAEQRLHVRGKTIRLCPGA
jgi:CRP/FNR family transcriptional regulator